MNEYWERSETLKNYLLENEIPVDTVSRCHVGFKNFYHIEFNISVEEYTLEISEKISALGRLLDVLNIGLVDFYEVEGRIHMVYIIDEEELHSKYFVKGSLVFH